MIATLAARHERAAGIARDVDGSTARGDRCRSDERAHRNSRAPGRLCPLRRAASRAAHRSRGCPQGLPRPRSFSPRRNPRRSSRPASRRRTWNRRPSSSASHASPSRCPGRPPPFWCRRIGATFRRNWRRTCFGSRWGRRWSHSTPHDGSRTSSRHEPRRESALQRRDAVDPITRGRPGTGADRGFASSSRCGACPLAGRFRTPTPSVPSVKEPAHRAGTSTMPISPQPRN